MFGCVSLYSTPQRGWPDPPTAIPQGDGCACAIDDSGVALRCAHPSLTPTQTIRVYNAAARETTFSVSCLIIHLLVFTSSDLLFLLHRKIFYIKSICVCICIFIPICNFIFSGRHCGPVHMAPLVAAAGLLALAASAAAVPMFNSSSSSNSTCRCVPGDACWPSTADWSALNHTVGGRLIATVPLASVCHDTQWGPYDKEKCDFLQQNWFYPETHLPSSSSIMAPFFTNDSCNPFSDRSAPCTMGNYVSYAINATGTADYQAAIAFVRKHNIRLTIRNTGHDYDGKATGAGALAIWTHYIKDKEIIDYASPGYTGKAAKLGAGVQVEELYRFANKYGYVAVGGDCPTVGVAGGFTQGGGHGPLASKFGLGTDQALEWEVVTGTGEILIANREINTDMYWALSGGGGGTYGVVRSLTVRIYPDLMTTAANLTFSGPSHPHVSPDDFWKAVEVFQAQIPAIADAGCFSIWFFNIEGFLLEPTSCPGLNKSQTMALLQPVVDSLKSMNISYELNIDQYDTFLPSYLDYDTPKNVSDNQYAGRLIPRSTIENNNTGLVNVYRDLVMNNEIALGGTSINITSQGFQPSDNSIDPCRRDTIMNMLLVSPYSYSSYETDVQRANNATYNWMPQIEDFTPACGYFNEADFQQPNFQEVFFGVNYGRLLSIKDRYDPDHIFYAVMSVGSDRWFENQAHGGALCRVP